ncbi:MAG: hypothetical protein OFPI_42380 [Osedax symbiont Rs2]|nr:MAG: hypothetical protein OFPI_42380 [Osedax symbiont Rs2]
MSERSKTSISFFQRMAFKLARLSVIVAFALGLVLSLIQVYIDFSQEKQFTGQKVDEIFKVTHNTAQRAIYQLDKDLAKEVLVGLSNVSFLHYVKIVDEEDEILAELTVDRQSSRTDNITQFLTSETATYESTFLSRRGEYQGRLTLIVSSDAALAPFYARASYVFLSGFLRNFVLSILLLLLFQYFLTRPFINLAEKFQNINPNNPSEDLLLIHDVKHKYDEVGYIVNSANILISEILVLNNVLEEKVAMRTQDLQQALEKLELSQQQLVEKEKMASMGQLIAGLAHEVNTPLGITITATSFLQDLTQDIRKLYAALSLTQQELDSFLHELEEGLELSVDNLSRAAQLIQDFKQVSVENSPKDVKPVSLKVLIEGVLLKFQQQQFSFNHQLHFSCSDFIVTCDSLAISQILKQLLLNSVVHAFAENSPGNIHIDVSIEQSSVLIHYYDDGVGLSTAHLKTLFDPFFTTKRNSGGTGLGTHVVYNLVTQALGGSISASSESGGGLAFDIRFPLDNCPV